MRGSEQRVRIRSGVATVALGLLLLSVCERAASVESLDFQLVYRGVFSMGRDLPFADLMLVTDMHALPTRTRIGLRASSAAYAFVEAAYPIRYRVRSWSDARNGHLVGFETNEKTRQEKHRLYLRDVSPGGTRRLKPTANDFEAQLRSLETGSDAHHDFQTPLFDRLGMLQALRRTALRPGVVHRLPVTDGKDRMLYRIAVEGMPTLTINGAEIPAWKLRFDADETDERGRVVAAHRPVFVWLSRDQARIPLRVEVRNSIGLFRARLVSLPRHERLTANRDRSDDE